MSKAEQTIVDLIKSHVWVMNNGIDDADKRKEEENKLTGMVSCLKNIKESERIYAFNKDPYTEEDKRYDFGYYDENIWYSLT